MINRRAAFRFQRSRPFGRLTPRRIHTLAVENIRPAIRIAHRLTGTQLLPERIIFDHEFVLFLKGEGDHFPLVWSRHGGMKVAA